MPHKNNRILLLWSMLCFVGFGCSNTRYLEQGETLYVGNEVEVLDSALSKSDRKNLETELSEIIRPRANSSFLGIRFKLWAYNVAGEPKSEKGLRHWLRSKIGEPPVLGSDMNISTNTGILNNYLENKGYFESYATGKKETKKRRTKAYFEVVTGRQTKIRNIEFPSRSEKIYRDIAATKSKSLLQPGAPYNLEVIKAERERIGDVLRNSGYYFFNPEYILAVADTGAGDHLIDLSITLKEQETPPRAKEQYRINEVVILPNYRLERARRNRRRGRPAPDTTIYENFKIVDPQGTFRPSVFYQAMQLKPGELYNQKDKNIALNRLVTLGTFKFVKNEFTPVGDSSSNLLDLTYYLTPYAKKAFNIDLNAFTQNDSRAGSRASIAWRNRNFLKGAELFTVKLSGGFEAQYGGIEDIPNTYNIGLETTLNVPRFIVPFINIKPSGLFIPRTLMTASYNYTFKADYYKIYTLSLGFGYNWKEDATKDHKLFPFNLSIVKTDTLDVAHASEINLSNLVFNGIILGPTYEYTYNSQLSGRQRADNFYFFGAADLSGNILGLVQGTSLDKPQKEIFGSAYAQYLKFQTDFRYYHNFTEDRVLASRLFLGFAYPYGNSHELPNIKQFFSGGSSSLRGFASRLVGPGTYHASLQTGTGTFIEMLGDIKMEASVEWRDKIYKFIKWGAFVDAGNIWLYRPHADFPGGSFSSGFYKELAVDAGLGLRLDFSILILRMDVGIPLRKPWYPEGQRWQLNNLHFGDPKWRGENIFFNLAIGYPF